MLRQATSTAYYVLIGNNTIREWKKIKHVHSFLNDQIESNQIELESQL